MGKLTRHVCNKHGTRHPTDIFNMWIHSMKLKYVEYQIIFI